MQLKSHSIENIKNSREIWLYWIASKRAMKARPSEPRFLRKVGDIVKTGGSTNGVTNFRDIRLLQRVVYKIGSGLSGAGAGRGCERIFRHSSSNK